ncbi:reticulocyte-binding protein PFD0110w-like [Chrysoperla carnea]|uniref:reticulocyte-binding protein PFD0110w-like n=1 Tax=Chrysoperla carnea TaxID=189513 RepID=UPI001D0747C5|nr:reticulocyte-binding protein PFD0110w-like [Chrysoperla carnea]
MPTYIPKTNFSFLTENALNYPIQITSADPSFMGDRCYSHLHYAKIINLEDIIPLDVIVNALKDIEKYKDYNNRQNCINRKELNRQKKFVMQKKHLKKLRVFQALCLWTHLPPTTSISLNRFDHISNITNYSSFPCLQNGLLSPNRHPLSIESINQILEASNIIIDDYNTPEKIKLFILNNTSRLFKMKNHELLDNGITEMYNKNQNSLIRDISNELQIFECQVQLTPSKHPNKGLPTSQAMSVNPSNSNKIVLIKERNEHHQINEFSIKIMQDLCKELDRYLKQINESRIIENKILNELEMCLQERQRKSTKRGKYTCKMTHSNMLLMNRTKLKSMNNNNNITNNISTQNKQKNQSKIPKYNYNSHQKFYNQYEGDTLRKPSNCITNIEDDGYNCPSLVYELEKTFIKHLEDHHKFITTLHQVRNSRHKRLICNKLKQFELLLNKLTNDENFSNETSETNSDHTTNSGSRNDLFSDKDNFKESSSSDECLTIKETSTLNLCNILSDDNIPTRQTDVLVLENKLSTFLLENNDGESNSSNINETTESENNSSFSSENLNNLFSVQIQQDKIHNVNVLSTPKDKSHTETIISSRPSDEKFSFMDANGIQSYEKFSINDTNNIFLEILNKPKSLLSFYNNDNFVQLFETIFHPFYSKHSSYKIHNDFNKAEPYSNRICTENIHITPNSNIPLYNFEGNIDFLFRNNGI